MECCKGPAWSDCLWFQKAALLATPSKHLSPSRHQRGSYPRLVALNWQFSWFGGKVVHQWAFVGKLECQNQRLRHLPFGDHVVDSLSGRLRVGKDYHWRSVNIMTTQQWGRNSLASTSTIITFIWRFFTFLQILNWGPQAQFCLLSSRLDVTHGRDNGVSNAESRVLHIDSDIFWTLNPSPPWWESVSCQI